MRRVRLPVRFSRLHINPDVGGRWLDRVQTTLCVLLVLIYILAFMFAWRFGFLP